MVTPNKVFTFINTNDSSSLQSHLRSYPMDIYLENGLSVISHAVLKNVKVAEQLIDFYEQHIEQYRLVDNPINRPNFDGSTALNIAVEMQDKSVVEFLLMKGGNPNVQTNDGDTPINLLTLYTENIELAKLLLNYGANPNIANKYGISAVRRAISSNKPKLLHLYLRYGGVVEAIKSSSDSELEKDSWHEYALPSKNEEINSIIEKWYKQHQRKNKSIKKKERMLDNKKRVEKEYLRLCSKLSSAPVEKVFQFAKKHKVETLGRQKKDICEDLATKLVIKRFLQ
jgi:ankyrin repeat protein